jgi:hypothetical protein
VVQKPIGVYVSIPSVADEQEEKLSSAAADADGGGGGGGSDVGGGKETVHKNDSKKDSMQQRFSTVRDIINASSFKLTGYV